ncbi:family 43 glycosylhydrolase [Gilvimarinus sp. SDUM040013]|uniref:Family 43 glycosylhydrolase n=1 Tax=Gilvimarinus gilvus TaxID=3058038 RepID=A0ABU4RWA0_9GAMM|nr:family 43 glycosylhydrolase [Gilvimarinus sp. SDUM040013]MDO3386566.1 family 43 glycosylhydrolase [Gilvimarinus sp. SDUM040013]MDX6849142.1 family 43 glycosylhydrolase [Gilvimarinus sp. SDUM040013]
MPIPFKRAIGAAALGLACVTAQADNPIIKDRFSADPAAIVHDGKVYLYVGHDEATVDGNFFVLREWNIYSSTDLESWTLEGAVPRTIFDWAEHDSAWASQAVEHDGKFYWYTTVRMPVPENGEGKGGYTTAVAVSDNPVTGWTDPLGKPLVDPNETEAAPHMLEHDHTWDDIDPSVFIDDDGQAYLYWGNSHLYYAKLAGDMISFAGDIHKVDIEGIPGPFTEAPWVHEKNGKYYLTFAMNYPEELAYAMSDSPTGPWVYKGLLMDVLEDSGTSHQAILEFEGEDYFIYHTSALPTGGNYRRSVSMEHLRYNADGTIKKLTPTASGITHSAQALQGHVDTDEYLRYGEGSEVGAAELNAQDHWQFKWHVKPLIQVPGKTTVSLQPETRMGYYVSVNDGAASIVEHDGRETFANSATFEQVAGLADADSVSLRTLDGSAYLILADGTLSVASPATAAERKAATFSVLVAE